MKYYINRKTEKILRDENNYTPYLTARDYEEITKEEYDQKSKELAELFEQEMLEQESNNEDIDEEE